MEIDYKKGILKYHDYTYSFNSTLKTYLNNYLLKTKKSFDTTVLNSKFTHKEIKYIEYSLKYIIRNQQELFKNFPLYYDFLDGIIDYLNNKYQIYISIDDDSNSLFEIKQQYTSIAFLRDLFNLAKNHQLIEENSQDSFVSVFLYKETTSIIHFITSVRRKELAKKF